MAEGETPPQVREVLDLQYPLPSPTPVDNVDFLDTPPQQTEKERRWLRKLLQKRRMFKQRLLTQMTMTNDNDDSEENFHTPPQQSTVVDDTLTELRTLMTERRADHMAAAAEVAKAAMEGYERAVNNDLNVMMPQITRLTDARATESRARTALLTSQRRAVEQRPRNESTTTPTAGMTNDHHVGTPTLDADTTEETAPAEATTQPKSIMKNDTDETTTEEDASTTPRRTLLQRLSDRFSGSTTPNKKKSKRRISFSIGDNLVKTKEYKVNEAEYKRDKDDAMSVVVYDREVWNEWKSKSDEDFLADFTVDFVTDNGSMVVRQVLFAANAKHLLRDIAVTVLRKANRVSWPKEKQYFVNLSPVRRQIKKRLGRSYNEVSEYNEETQRTQGDDGSQDGGMEA